MDPDVGPGILPGPTSLPFRVAPALSGEAATVVVDAWAVGTRRLATFDPSCFRAGQTQVVVAVVIRPTLLRGRAFAAVIARTLEPDIRTGNTGSLTARLTGATVVIRGAGGATTVVSPARTGRLGTGNAGLPFLAR